MLIFKELGLQLHDKNEIILGIEIRLMNHLAKRFKNRVFLETLTGAGFSAISIAKYAKHVYSIELDGKRLEKANTTVKFLNFNPKLRL